MAQISLTPAVQGRKRKKEMDERLDFSEKTHVKVRQTYTYKIPCSNCRATMYNEIPVGQTVDEFIKINNCINCNTPYNYHTPQEGRGRYVSDEEIKREATRIYNMGVYGAREQGILMAHWMRDQIFTSPPEMEREKTNKDFLRVLQDNWQAQIAGYYNVDKTDAERTARDAVIREYQDLIALYKSHLEKLNSTPRSVGDKKDEI